MSLNVSAIRVMLGLAAALFVPAMAGAAPPSLVGSWQFTLVPTTPPIPSIPVPGLATFTSDGTVVETNALEVVPGSTPTFSTPGHGIWQPGPAVPTLFVQFISVVANANGSLNAKNNTTMTLMLNAAGTQFKGGYTTVRVDPTGKTIQTISGTVSGQIIPHPLLP
ncbi:MAG: hypothetical protein U0Q18_30245 [Bryobacteraceae bacterium]